MRTIYKYELPSPSGSGSDCVSYIEMPSGAELLDVQGQQQGAVVVPVIWAIVETRMPMVKRGFVVKPTGVESAELCVSKRDHVGTFQVGPYVFHVFDRGIEQTVDIGGARRRGQEH